MLTLLLQELARYKKRTLLVCICILTCSRLSRLVNGCIYFRLSGSDESLAVGQLETLLSSRTFTHLLFQLFDADQVSFFISSVYKVKCFLFLDFCVYYIFLTPHYSISRKRRHKA